MEELEISIGELDARASHMNTSKDKDDTTKKEVLEVPIGIPIEDLPMVKSQGGRHLEAKDERDNLTAKDLEIIAMLACGSDKVVTANLSGINRTAIYALLDSKRIERLTKGARARLSSLAPLAVEIIHSELVKGNVEVAQQVLKGLNLLKQSVNQGTDKFKTRSMAEEIVEQSGRVVRRVTEEVGSDD